jgi:hypothetical protein
MGQFRIIDTDKLYSRESAKDNWRFEGQVLHPDHWKNKKQIRLGIVVYNSENFLLGLDALSIPKELTEV